MVLKELLTTCSKPAFYLVPKVDFWGGRYNQVGIARTDFVILFPPKVGFAR